MATFALALSAVVLSLGSLIWQGVSFARSGSWVVAHLRVGVHSLQMGSITIPPTDNWREQMNNLLQEHGGEAVLVMEASNRGRLAVGMERIQAATPTGWRYGNLRWSPPNPKPGETLQAGHHARWFVDLEGVQLVVDTHATSKAATNASAAVLRGKRADTRPRPVRVWLELELGDSSMVRTKESITVMPTERSSGSEQASPASTP